MKTKKILFVDDEPDVAELVKQTFENRIGNFDVELIFAENGKDALKKIEQDSEIELILTDINMPEMDGLELLGILTKLTRILEVVMVTAYGDMANIRKAMNQGAYDFIMKPIDFEDVTITVEKALKKIERIKAEYAELGRLKEIEKETEIARKILTSLLPSTFTPIVQHSSLEIFGTLIPAKIISGQFYDFFPVGDDKYAIIVAETTLKGISGAVSVASVRESIRIFMENPDKLPHSVQMINEFINTQNSESLADFQIFVGVYNYASGVLDYISNGVPSYLLSQTGEIVENPYTYDRPLGKETKTDFHAGRVTLTNNTTLAIFSNGLALEKNKAGEIYKDKRLEAILRENSTLSPAHLVDTVVENIRKFTPPAEQTHDYVLLCLRKIGS